LSTNNPCAIDEAVSRSDAQAHDRATAFHSLINSFIHSLIH
jgi:hypothetical protein